MRSGPTGRLAAWVVSVAVASAGCGAGAISTTPASTTQPPPPTTAPPMTEAAPSDPITPWFDAHVLPVSEGLLGTSWREGCPVGPDELRLVVVTHWDFDGDIRAGELVVHEEVAEDTVSVFEILFDEQFPLERVEAVQFYGSDDNRSMAANNTSAFNCRTVAGTDSWSEHAYGRAIDINPVQNPYVGSNVSPPAGAAFIDRSDVRPGMVAADDVVVRAFASIGWKWGGEWSRPDYQHFSQSGR